MHEPAYGIALAASRGMLDKVPFPDSAFGRVFEQFANYIELVVTRKDLLVFLFIPFLVFFLYDLRIIFQNIGQAVFA